MSEATSECAMPTVTPEHKVLDQFVGTWNAKTLFWMQPGTDPIEMGGTMKNTWAFYNLYLEQDYTVSELMGQKSTDQKFMGRGLWTYNPAAKTYEGVWYDTAASTLQFERGGFDAAKKVYTAHSEFVAPGGHGEMTKRTVITIKNANEHVMEMFMGPKGSGPDQQFRCMQITFTRA